MFYSDIWFCLTAHFRELKYIWLGFEVKFELFSCINNTMRCDQVLPVLSYYRIIGNDDLFDQVTPIVTPLRSMSMYNTPWLVMISFLFFYVGFEA